MLTPTLLNLPCSIVNRSFQTRDEMGNDVASESTVTTVCELQQRQRDEEDEQVTEGSYLLVVPVGTVIGAADSVSVDGVEYQVSGQPWEVRNPRTETVSHIEATVMRVAGAGTGS